MIKELKSLIISPDTQSRMRLAEALNLTSIKSSVLHARNCRAGFEIVEREQDVATIFIHSTIDQESIGDLYHEIKRADLRYKPVLVVTLHADHNLSDYISENLLSGVEGFLKEPFATDDVNDVIQLALGNRQVQVDDEQKELKALQFMLKDALGLLDEVALERLKRNGRGGGFAYRRMKRLRLRLRNVGQKFDAEQIFPCLDEETEERIKNLDLSLFRRREVKVPYAKHPGKILTEIIEERSLTFERLNEMLSVDKDELLSLLEGRGGMTQEISKALARVLGRTPHHWLSLQTAYDNYKRANPDR